jgi:hypothetical protein
MKRFCLLLFFLFIFCLGAAGAVFAGEPKSVNANFYTGPFAAVPKGQVNIEVHIRDERVMPIYDVPYEWELFKSGVSTGKVGSSRTNIGGYSLDEIVFTDLEDDANYRLDVWVGDKIASLSFRTEPGKGMSDSDELVVTDRKRSGGSGGGGSGGGCSAFGSGMGVLVLAGLALLKKRSGH